MKIISIPGRELYCWYLEAKEKAIANNIEPQELDWLLKATTDLSGLSLRLGSFANRETINSDRSVSELDRLWSRRIEDRLPVQYLLEKVFWRHFQLKVTPSVLIPRPETELIIDIALEAIKNSNLNLQSNYHWVDLGTGSGAIALGLADIFPQATIHAVDCSSAALEIARENARNLNLDRNIRFYQSNWWDELTSFQGKVTGMVSNPPYIPTAQVQKLQPEVVKHEPHLALDGGVDGLDDIRYLVESAPQYLVSGGIWLIEMAIAQADRVAELLEGQKEYYDIKVIPDLNGIDRFVLAYKV